MQDFNSDAVKDLAKKVILTQQPREGLTLQFSIKPELTNLANRRYEICKRRYELSQASAAVGSSKCSKFTCDLSLTFENNLHDVSQDYGYEVEFEVHVKSGGLYQKMYLFSHQQMRRGRTIRFETQEFCMSNSYKYAVTPHLCCHIRRFRVKDNGSSSNSDDYVGITLLKTGCYSDVSLVVGDKIFPAHKNVLSSRSDFFKAMFSHVEMSENVTGNVVIVDINAKIVEEMLHYLYTGRAKNLDKYARQLFLAADKYGLDELRAQCVEQLLFDLNCENVVEVLKMTIVYEVPRLKDGAMAFLDHHLSEVVQQENYQRYLCSSLNDSTIVNTLKLCVEYNLDNLKAVAFEFIQNHVRSLVENPEFMNLFNSHPNFMKEIFVYITKQM